MTRDEFVAKYADVKLKFSCVYKFHYVYIGKTSDNNEISIDIWLDHNEAYQHVINVDDMYNLRDLADNCSTGIVMRSPTSEILYKFDDYY